MCILVVLNYNDADTVERYLDNIRGYTCFEHIILVDNCSTDDSYSKLMLHSGDKTTVLKTEVNKGYGYGNNFGIQYAVKHFQNPCILISNPDVVVKQDTIIELEKKLRSDDTIGVVTAMMQEPDGAFSKLSAWKIPTFWQKVFVTAYHRRIADFLTGTRLYPDIHSWNSQWREVDCVPGSFLMINATNMLKAGAYDENIFLYGEESVLGIRMKKHGFKTMLNTKDSFLHFHSVSVNKSIKREKDRMSIMWKSRKYILEHYYKMNALQKIIVNIYAGINISSISRRIEKAERR